MWAGLYGLAHRVLAGTLGAAGGGGGTDPAGLLGGSGLGPVLGLQAHCSGIQGWGVMGRSQAQGDLSPSSIPAALSVWPVLRLVPAPTQGLSASVPWDIRSPGCQGQKIPSPPPSPSKTEKVPEPWPQILDLQPGLLSTIITASGEGGWLIKSPSRAAMFWKDSTWHFQG